MLFGGFIIFVHNHYKVMECFEFGFNITNDSDGKLAKSVEAVAGYNSIKAKVLAGYVNSQEFLDYCKKSEKFDSTKSLAENNQNTVRSLLRKYFRERHKDVVESAAKAQAEAMQGFSSVNAKNVAIDYTATVINRVYNSMVQESKGKHVKLDRKKVINQALSTMETEYINGCVIPLYKTLREKMSSLFDEKLDAFKEAQNEVAKLTKELKEFKRNIKKNADAIKETTTKLLEAKRNRYNIAHAFVAERGNVVQKNYNNMIEQAKGNPNAWFNAAFDSSKLVSIVNEFKNTLESDKLIDENFQDENDVVNPDSESVDEMSKSWEDKLWASFDKSVAADLKLYFNSLYRLSAPSELGNKKYSYDTNNEVGVPTTMGANFVIAQLINYGNYNSVNDFIESVINMSQQVPELYGFIAIADRAVEDPVFANYLFTQLASPKIIKTMNVLTEEGIDFTQSNKSADALSYVVYNMLNATRSTMTDVFTTNDVDKLNELKTRYKNLKNDFFNATYTDEADRQDFNKIKSEIEDTIYDILKKYYPKLNIIALKGYLYHDPAHVKDSIDAITNNLISLLRSVEYTVEEYNIADAKGREAYKSWITKKNNAIEAGLPFTEAAPIRDMSTVDYSRLNYPIIDIAKKLVNYTAVKNELNSVNAEGNLASDIINNSWITNTFKQIAYGNKQDANAGLNRLLEEVTKGEQYRYTPLFWGVKDSKGNYLSEGLFIRDNGGNVRVNHNARKIIQVSLFNGIKDSDNSNAVMYNRMSKGDYFLTNLYAYFNPIAIGENIGTSFVELSQKYAGYFMRTPSDAPKNFIVQAPKLNAQGILTPIASSVTAYANKIRRDISLLGFRDGVESKYQNEYDDYIIGSSKITKKQVWNASDIYEIFNGTIDNINYNNMYSIQNEDGSVTVPIVYRSGDDTDIVWLKGQKVQGETNNILYNFQVEDITGTNDGNMSDSFYADIADIIRQEGLTNGQIETTVNRNVAIFVGIRQNLLNELNTYIDQLNNVFKKDTKGNWKLRKDITGLIDRAHYNITYDAKGNLQYLVQGEYLDSKLKKRNPNAGKLSGNFFSFRKLFQTDGVNVQELMEQQLFLYGGLNDGLIHLIQQSGSINMNHGLVREENGRLVLNLSNETNQILDSITEQWIKGFNKEVVRRTQQYDKLLTERFSVEQVFDCMLNSANVEMSFDDLFEGDVKFYKNAQDFLKRAKEVQAAGKAYAGFDINDSLSQEIKDCIDRNGNVQPITVAGVNIAEFTNAYSPVEGKTGEYHTSANARNGFRAVTIYNTVRPSKYANRIREEVFNILKNKMSEEQATKIAQQVYAGYADNTKTNDAQSYITLEEFIRRRYADGTLDQYQDILSQIYAIRRGEKIIKDIDLSSINARIQVQKNFYFDKHFDTATRTHYARQIKNAEFVLIPELLEGTELKQLYDIMMKHDIGQVNTAETSKAAKKNILTFWDNNGNINPNFEQEMIANGEAAIEDYYYRFLYKQQDVPEHMKDEHNKAGIQIMKKIIDNADESVAPYIKQFFDNYCANIKDDFNKMIFNMGWKVNKDGSLSNIDDTKEVLDFTDFYSKARHEAQRLGLDENFIDYITPDELGNPTMPNYMNNVSSKLESIAQAIFNSNITRQKLPGWHAAQVTQIGHGMKVLDSNGKLRELKYHPTVYNEVENPYKNVKVELTYTPDTADANGMGAVFIGRDENGNAIGEFYIDAYYDFNTKSAKSWRKKDLDENKVSLASIGQAVTIDKEFRGKGYGKAFYYQIAIELGKQGKTLVSAADSNRTEDANRVWKSLVKDGYAKKINDHYEFINEKILSVKQEAYAEVMIPRWSNLILKDYPIEQLEKEGLDIQIAYRIPTEGKQSVSVVKVVGFLDDVYGSTIMLPNEWVTQTGADFDVDSVYAVCHEIYAVRDKKTKAVIDIKKWTAEAAGSDLGKYRRYISENIENKIPSDLEDDELHPNKYKQFKERLKKAVKDKDYAEINKIGKEAGLMTFNEFKALPEVEKLPRQVRNNNILDAMIAIMSSENSREENYSRSNFDDITDAMKEMNDARGASSIARSTYNLLDQIDFMENAMSGASLKAFSVTRDTFNSVNNYIKSELGKGHEIIVEYDITNDQYDYDAIVNAYGLYDSTTKKGDAIPLDKNGKLAKSKEDTVKLRVKHYRLANSNNNRNVIGKLATVYSSETTAHILDAIKEGAIYNENEYTFGTFKTLIDTGIDYRTAIAFLMQPAITTINEVNNETNSIYISGGGNAIKTAIKRIAANAGYTLGSKPITDYSDYDTVMLLLNTDKRFQEAVYELFGAEISNNKPFADVVFSLDVNRLKNRLKQAEITNNPALSQEDKVIRDAAFDIAMALTFNKIHDTTQSLEKIMRCSNPDRFGAKQTVRATRMIRDNIKEYGFNEKNPINKVVRVGNKNLLEALYPGFGSENGIRVEESAYPYLAAFFKYATEPSIQANSVLFPTENKQYTDVTNAAQQKLGVIFNDEQYREYKQYMMSQVYASVPYLTTPLTITEEGWFDTDDKTIIAATENDENYWNKEISRIFGYTETSRMNIDIKDIYDPKRGEIEAFNKLTPAQKVLWIQTNLNDGRGIFEYLNVNKFNQWEYKNKGYTQQTIRFTDSSDNLQEVYLAFNNSFYNTSPIIRLATMDLIKYAFVVEGFKFKKGGLSKIITNNAMYKNIEDMGMNIIPVVRRVFQYYDNPANAVTTKFIDRFIRSHSEYAKTLRLDRPENKHGNANLAFKFNIYGQGDGLVFIPFEKRAEDLLAAINVEDVDSPQEYIKVSKWVGKNKRTNVLYKIRKTEKGIYLIPLNLLERNETGDFSINSNNNKYPDISYYNSLIDTAIAQNVAAKELTKDGSEVKEVYSKLRKESILPRFKFTTVKESLENKDEFRRILINGTELEKGEIKKFISHISDYVNSPVEGKGSYVLVRSNSKFIANQIPRGVSVIQNIPVGDDIVTVSISHAKQPKQFANSIKNKDKLNLNELSVEERAAYEDAFAGGAIYSSYYKVTPVTNEEVREQVEKQDQERENNIAPDMAAITSDATDFYVREQDKYDIVDSTAKDMMNALKRAERQGDVNAAKARRTLEMKNINEGRSEDIVNNRKSIYSVVAQYMEIYSNILDNTINHYKIDGEEYNLGQNELYTALREHPEEVEPIVKLLLEAITFGNTFGEIMTLPFDGLDTETINAIKRIRNSITKIRNNNIIKRGFDRMFNNYIANEYSTNPNVRMGLVNLNDTFGDAGWWESWIGDTAMISNKEIQTVVKIVNNIMTQAAIKDAPKRKQEFLDRLDGILDKPGTFRWENVIDKQGRLIRPYTSQFIEERNRLRDAVQEARDTYGEDSFEYINAKLERDEWYAENVHQIVVPEYYRAKNANIRKVLVNAPQEYLEYMKLIHELYNDNRPTGILTKEERDRRKEINRKINQLTSEYKDEQTLKSEEERFRANQLKKYIEEKRRLDSEYFEWNEAYGFKEALANNLAIIERYEKKHPDETLDKRLQDESYREAYEWVKDNSYYILDEDAQKAITDAFKTLKDEDNVKSKQVRKILNDANAFDDFGNIDPRKLSDEDIAKIKELTKHKYDFSYDSNAGEAILIKDIPTGLPVLKDSFYRMLRDPSENEKEVNPRRIKIIGRINELLGKCIGYDGRIHAKDIFEKLTEDEREQLAEGYRALKAIKGKRKPKSIREKFKKNVDFMVNTEAFNEEYAWALTNIKGTKNFDTFLDIFVQTDSSGEIQLDDNGNYIPNNDIYGYIVPKDDIYIDEDKTKARQLIEDNLDFVPTEYYYAAIHEATEKDNFAEWFQKNHVFNPYKHKFEPLRIWTTMKVNPNGSLKGTYSYVPTYENQEKSVKEEYVNPNYKQYSTNYNVDTGKYNNFISLSDKEKQVQELLQEAINFFAKYNNNSPFIEQGFIPRKRKVETDTKWFIKQALGSIGLEYRNDSEDKWYEKVDYTNDREIDNGMLHLLRGKGYKELEKIRPRGLDETPEEYQKYLEAVKERNAEIKAKNLEIDNALMDNDYKTVFAEAIYQQVINNAKSKAKNWLYLLQEDLRNNEAYAISSLTGKLVTDKKSSTDANERFVTTKQNRALDSVEAFTRRVIFDQFKKRTPLNKYADLARNITSAKYMIFNVTGGIANVGTGFVNIIGEAFAEDNFTKKDLREAVGMYLQNSVSMIVNMYKDKSSNFAVALTKYFNVVDFDAMSERVPGETAGEYARRIRNLMYSLQSGGEHFMQNSVLFAVLKQSRIFNDVDGTKRCGTFQQYIWKTEYDTLLSIIGNDETLMDNLGEMKRQIRTDKQEAYKYDTFRRNIVEEFLRAHCSKEQIKEYVAKRSEAIKKAKEKWDKMPTAIDQLELGNDGVIHIKDGSELTQDMINGLRNTTIALNKKIHGVYDKIGAARIEFSWWGGLVMQYHKHIYPGIMKRFRWRGYYNEQTNTIEIGSYAALVRLLGREFRGLNDRVSKRKDAGENEAIASVRETAKAVLDAILNIRTNWNLMPQWERNAVKRTLGDLYGIVSSMLMGISIYAMTDDDDEKESELIATALYLSDRLLSESQMYTPWGLISEASTLWSSPIAATNGPEDLLKGLGFLIQWMFDEDFDPTYKTGLYAGQNKGWVLLKRNIPLYRVIDRLSNMTKNNSYYRVNEKSLNMRFSKMIADEINPD